MSKAFTKDEGEGSEPADLELDPLRDLPAGTKNYMTRQGYEALRKEMLSLSAEKGESAIRRARYLERVLESAEVVDTQNNSGERVLFGAHVTVASEDSGERTFQIVGIHEADPQKGKISWTSPVAKALLNMSVGDEVTLRTPMGEESVEIVDVSFK